MSSEKLQDKFQSVFKYCYIILFLIEAPHFYLVYQFQKPTNAHLPEGYEWPSISSFQRLPFYLACYFIFGRVIDFIARPICMAVCKDKEEFRIERMTDNISNCAMKLFNAIRCYRVLTKSDWFPWYMGGTADSSGAPFCTGMPYFTNGPISEARDVMVCEMGFFIYATFCTSLKNANFHEMMLHHLVTLSLQLTSFWSNYLSYALIIQYTLDPADIFVRTSKFLSDTKFKLAATISGAFMFLVFAYTRSIVLPFIVYRIYDCEYPSLF